MKTKFALIISVLLLIALLSIFGACYQPIIGGNSITVNFYDGDTLLKTESVKNPEDVLSYVPEKEGMVFKGWYVDNLLTMDFETLSTDPQVTISLYAFFEPEVFEVVFLDDSENPISVNGEATQSVEYGEAAISPAAPEKEGFVFTGWSVAFDDVRSDLTIRAVWRAAEEECELVFVLGATQLFSEEVEEGTFLAAYANTVEDDLSVPAGFAFDGWFADSAFETPLNVNSATVPETGITVYGKLRLVPISGLYLESDMTETPLYSEELGIELSASLIKYEDINYSYEWFFDSISGNPISGSSDSIILEGLNAGTHTVAVKVTAAADAGSVNAVQTITFEIAPAALTGISAENVNETYDKTPHSITIDGIVDGDVVSYALSGGDFGLEEIEYIDAGVYTIRYKVERINYEAFISEATVTVEKALLTVRAENKTTVYGADMPVFTYNCSGFLSGDTQTALSGSALFECEIINTLTVGQYNINVDGFTADNYNISYEGGVLTVDKRPLYVTADDKTAAYGGIAPIFTAQITGFYGSDTVNLLNGEIGFDCTYSSGSDAGSYPIVPKGLSSDKYEMEYVAGNLEVTKRVLTVTADNKSAYYGDNAPALTVKYSGFLEGDDQTELGGELLFYCRYRKGNDVGTYPIVPSGLESANYDITYVSATLTVLKIQLTITADNKTAVYGDEIPVFTVQYSGFIEDEDESSLTGELRFECQYEKGGSAGVYAITAEGLASNSYDVNYISGNLTVSKKSLVVSADDKSVVYGDGIPEYSASYDGFIEGDSVSVLTGEAFFGCEYVEGSDTGAYPITVSNLYSSNYLITFEQGSLNVEKAELVVTAVDKSVIYGAVAPVYTANYSGFKSGDNLASLSGSLEFECGYIAGSIAGNYDIEISGFASDNYDIVYVEGNLTVDKRAISIKANKNFAYNGNAWQKTDWATITGMYATDTICGVLKSNGADAGVYIADGSLTSDFFWEDFDILSGESISVAASYEIDYELSIEIKENCFDYTAEDCDAVYDGNFYSASVETTLPTGVITYSVNGIDYYSENPSFVDAGTHSVYFNIEDTDEYYDDISGICEVRIAKAILTVTADDASVVYGQEAPEFVADIAGYVNSENASVLYGSMEFECTYDVGSGAGEYTITPFGLNADNYDFDYLSATLTVSKAALTVTASDGNVSYGDSAPEFSVEYVGLIAGDTSADIAGTLSYNCQYIAGSALGSYAITPYGLSSLDYQITYVAGTLTVDAKNITVYAVDAETVYGSSFTAFSAACDDLFGSDTIEDIAGITFLCDYSSGDDAGEYPITVSGGSNANYIIGYLAGTLTVTPKEITVTADDKTAVYGDASIAYSFTASGLVAGDSAAMLGTPDYDCDYLFGSDVGEYTVTPSGLINGNYSYTYLAGTVTVTAKSAAVIWYGTDTTYYYNATNQGSSVTPGITDIYDDTIYTGLTFSGTGSAFLNAGNYILTASLNDENYTLTNTVTSLRMYKGEYTGITHRDLTGTYSPTQTLTNIALDSYYFWATPGAVPTVPVTEYTAYYNADFDNYNNFELTVTVNLQKALATVTGSTVQSANYGSAASLTLGVAYDGTALSTSLYTFNYSNGNSFTTAGTYKTSVTITSDNYRVNPTDFYMKVKGVLYNSNYYTIEDALNAASSGTIIITTDTSFASADNSCYNGTGYYTVKSGVELLVPYSSSYSTTKNGVNDTSTALGSKYVRLTIPSNITLTVNGTLNVNAVRSHQSRSMGHTAGAYGELKLEQDAIITLNSGATLNCMGFITGTGYINALSGSTVYDVLAIKDWRGGKVSYSIKDDYFAFNQYTMHNIEARLRIYQGSSMYCRYYVYTSVATVNDQMIVIGNGAVFQLGTGYLEKFMDAANGRTYLDLYGTMTTNSTTLELNSGVPLVGSFSINTNNKEFPLSGNYTMTMKTGSTGTVNNRFKLLPGAEFIVEQGATLNITSSGRIYAFGNGVTFSNGVYTGTPNTPPYGGTACKVNTRTKNLSYLLTDNARIIINGTLNMAGYIGGLIETTGTTGVINLTGTLSSTMKDRLNVTKVNTFGVDYNLENVSFTAKGYINGDTSTMVNLAKTTYHADTNGTNTWI